MHEHTQPVYPVLHLVLDSWNDTVSALTFCRPFIPAGRLGTVESILSAEEAQGSEMLTDRRRKEMRKRR